MPASHYCTAAMVLALPEDGNTYATVHGELLVSPGARVLHQLVLARLIGQVDAYLKQYPVGLWFPEGNISWSEDTLVIPDLLVADPAEVRTMEWERVKTLLLVVEILSRSTARQDRFTKRRLYQEVGVPLYWLVDPDTRTVEAWTPDAISPVTEHQAVRWHPAGAAEPLVIPLNELFQPV